MPYSAKSPRASLREMVGMALACDGGTDAGLIWAAARRRARSGWMVRGGSVVAGRRTGLDLVERSLLFSVILLRLRMLAVVRFPRRRRYLWTEARSGRCC